MRNLELAFRRQPQDVAAIDFHHAPEFCDYGAQEAVEIDAAVIRFRAQIGRETVDDRLARFVHLDLALKRKRGCFD